MTGTLFHSIGALLLSSSVLAAQTDDDHHGEETSPPESLPAASGSADDQETAGPDATLLETPRGFGSPDAVQNRIEADRLGSGATLELDFLAPYRDWKEQFREDTGFSFGLAHISLGVAATKSLPGLDDFAASGVFRHFGSWELLGRGTGNTGTLNYLVEHRHRYTDSTPSEFGIANLGYAGFTGIPYANDSWHLTNLYWLQSWNEGRVEVGAGYLDITDFVDVWALTSPWTDFSNFVFSIGAGTMDLPDDGALGFAGGAYLTDNLYLIAGFEDLNSDPGDPTDGFDTFFNDNEYFKHVEIGWTGTPDIYYLDNLHLTLWHADERDKAGIEDGWGAMLSLSKSIESNWLVFARGGFAEDGGSLLSRSVSAGFGYQPSPSWDGSGDLLAVGVNWGRPNDNLFGDVDDQWSFEAYYRWQIAPQVAITPDVQLLVDPALNPDEDTIWVFGLRARVAF